MKKYLTVILLFSSLSSMSEEVIVKSIARDEGFDGRFTLMTLTPHEVVLDCQSFIQGMFFSQDVVNDSVLLDEWECADLSEGIFQSVENLQHHCLDVDFDARVLVRHWSCKGHETK